MNPVVLNNFCLIGRTEVYMSKSRLLGTGTATASYNEYPIFLPGKLFNWLG